MFRTEHTQIPGNPLVKDHWDIIGVLISVSCVGWYCGLKHFTMFLFTKYLKGFAFNFAKRINFVFQYSVAQFIINIHDIFAKIMCLKV